jgi:hypothetical protein
MGRQTVFIKEPDPQARNKLFEKFMSQVLGRYGYRLAHIKKINHTAMEIEFEGKHEATGAPFYAECKYSETAVSAHELQAFFGKYMTRWHRDKRCHGLLIALPGVDSIARTFYLEHIATNPEVTTLLYEENEVLQAVMDMPGAVHPDTIAKRIARTTGKPGDRFLLYTAKGLFWIQYVSGPDKKTTNSVAVFDNKGVPLSDRPSFDFLAGLYPELVDCDNIAVSSTAALQPGLFQDDPDIIELQGSSEYFEHQFPASAAHFVGRKSCCEKLNSFAKNVISKKTSCRGVLLEAPPGWGKSSLVLAWTAGLKTDGHFAVAIDSRSISSSRSIPYSVDYAIRQSGDFGGRLPLTDRIKPSVDFANAVRAMLEIGQSLERHGILMLIFFDQFEHILGQPDILFSFQKLLQKVSDAQTNVVLGFSLTTGLIDSYEGSLQEMPTAIANLSRHIILEPFKAAETNEILEKLSNKLKETLKKDLRFHMAEFSQGYPWLLKKLCSRVIALRQAGLSQADIVMRLHSIEALFREDLRGLPSKTSAMLHRIAHAAPVRILETSANYDHKAVQSLARQGLLINIGNIYDVYADAFRDYLTDNKVPANTSYLLLAKVGHVLRATKILKKANGSLDAQAFRTQTALSEKAFYHVARDMKLLGLVKMDKGKIILKIHFPEPLKDFEFVWRRHIRDRLQLNRQVRRLLKALEENQSLTIDQAALMLEVLCPYISSPRQTWLAHARCFAKWMDTADLALEDSKNRTLFRYDPATEIREHHLLLPKRSGRKIPQIQYSPVEGVAIRLVQALKKDGSVAWTGLKKSTIFSALATLEDLGFIQRRTRLIKVLPKGFEFVANPDQRPRLFAESALQLNSFAAFIEILTSHQDKGHTLLALGLELRAKLGANWQESTAETTAKIMMDWARHAKLAPGVFAQIRKGPLKGWKKKEDLQIPLF